MTLSKRLGAMAQLVPPGSIVADIGTDHGYLPCYLVESGRAPQVIACDVNQGPLLMATKNIAQRHLEEQIVTRLGDGLAVLAPGEVDTVTISGMGAGLMVEILNRSPEVVAKLERLILQPNLAAHLVRLWAAENGWQIADEELVLEEGRYYEIIVLTPGAMAIEETMAFIGPALLAKKHHLLPAYLAYVQEGDEQILAKLALSQTAQAQEKAAYLRDKWQKIREVIK